MQLKVSKLIVVHSMTERFPKLFETGRSRYLWKESNKVFGPDGKLRGTVTEDELKEHDEIMEEIIAIIKTKVSIDEERKKNVTWTKNE